MGEPRGDETQRGSKPDDGKTTTNMDSNAGHDNDSGGGGGGGSSGANITRGKSMQVEEPTVRNEFAMVTRNDGLQEIGLTKPPPEGNVPLLQVSDGDDGVDNDTQLLLAVIGTPECCWMLRPRKKIFVCCCVGHRVYRS